MDLPQDTKLIKTFRCLGALMTETKTYAGVALEMLFSLSLDNKTRAHPLKLSARR